MKNIVQEVEDLKLKLNKLLCLIEQGNLGGGTGGGITTETDPIFTSSSAYNITNTDINNWNNPTFNESDPVFTQSVAYSITQTDIDNWNSNGSISNINLYDVTTNGNETDKPIITSNYITARSLNIGQYGFGGIHGTLLTDYRVYDLPDKSGTLALESDIPPITERDLYNLRDLRLPLLENMYIAGLIDSNYITYKTDTYRQLDVESLIRTINGYESFDLFNCNEVIKIGNTIFLTCNFDYSGVNSQYIVALRDCYIENFELKVSSISINNTTIKSVHSLIYNPIDDFIYIGERTFNTHIVKIVKISPHSLAVVKSSNLPNTNTYKYGSTDIKIFNNKLYFTVGTFGTFKIVEMNTDLETYTEIYSGTTNQSMYFPNNQAFEIYNGKFYTNFFDNTSADRYTNIIILELDLLTLQSRVSPKINVPNNSNVQVQSHWMTVYGDKLFITTNCLGSVYMYKSLIRLDIKTFTKEDEVPFDMSITDDNSIINGYIYLNGESFFGSTWFNPTTYPNYPNNNAKLIRINPFNFTDVIIELPVFNEGKGSYGSINYNSKSSYPIEKLRQSFTEVNRATAVHYNNSINLSITDTIADCIVLGVAYVGSVSLNHTNKDEAFILVIRQSLVITVVGKCRILLKSGSDIVTTSSQSVEFTQGSYCVSYEIGNVTDSNILLMVSLYFSY